MTPLSFGNFCWSRMVWNLVNAAPILKSISDLASHASDKFWFNVPRFWTAFLISYGIKAENLARKILSREFTCSQMLFTSNAMFSPSRSQSSHNTSHYMTIVLSANILCAGKTTSNLRFSRFDLKRFFDFFLIGIVFCLFNNRCSE